MSDNIVPALVIAGLCLAVNLAALTALRLFVRRHRRRVADDQPHPR
jgi:hypothetical protein